MFLYWSIKIGRKLHRASRYEWVVVDHREDVEDTVENTKTQNVEDHLTKLCSSIINRRQTRSKKAAAETS